MYLAVFPYSLTSFTVSAKPPLPSHSWMLCKAGPEAACPNSGKWTQGFLPTDIVNSTKLFALFGLCLWPQEQNALFKCRPAFLPEWVSVHCAVCSSSCRKGEWEIWSFCVEKSLMLYLLECIAYEHALLHILWSIAKEKMHPIAREQYKLSNITLALCSWSVVGDFLSVVHLF